MMERISSLGSVGPELDVMGAFMFICAVKIFEGIDSTGFGREFLVRICDRGCICRYGLCAAPNAQRSRYD
jgi:hypothetical protein